MRAQRLVSRLDADGTLTVWKDSAEVGIAAPGELLVRVDGAPINPADVKAMFCGVHTENLHTCDVDGQCVIRGQLSPESLPHHAQRIGKTVALGNEGTGLVIGAGCATDGQELVGKRIAVASPGMFSDICLVNLADCIVLPTSIRPKAAAAAWINPLTALAMVETMRREGHRGLVLTAAASNLGKMLNRLCLQDGIPLVNIVRSSAAMAELEAMGASHVCHSADPGFEDKLTNSLAATGATLAFDATGGGSLAGRILQAMEKAAALSAPRGQFGSSVHKQVYFFGGLDPSPVCFPRTFGMAWGMGGWLLQTVLARLGPRTVSAMKARVREELETLFRTDFERNLGLDDVLLPENVRKYSKMGTSGKALVRPLSDDGS